MNKQNYAEVALKGGETFKRKADEANSEEERLSLLRCAEASLRLAPKLAKLQAEENLEGLDLLAAANSLADFQILVTERKFRASLSERSE